MKITSVLFAEGIRTDSQFLCDLATKIANKVQFSTELLALSRSQIPEHIYLELAVRGVIENNQKKIDTGIKEFIRSRSINESKNNDKRK